MSQLNQNAFFVFYNSCFEQKMNLVVSLPVRMEMQEKYFLAININFFLK